MRIRLTPSAPAFTAASLTLFSLKAAAQPDTRAISNFSVRRTRTRSHTGAMVAECIERVWRDCSDRVYSFGAAPNNNGLNLITLR